jgi:hypothetical protein
MGLCQIRRLILLWFLDALEVVRLLSQPQRRESLLHDGSNAGKVTGGTDCCASASLEKGVRDGGEHGDGGRDHLWRGRRRLDW